MPTPYLPEYEYKGLMAHAWDILRGDTSQWADRFFYLQLIQATGQPVLDVGCGTGRLLLDYAAQGIEIDGVDNSPEMLAICRQKAQQYGVSPNIYEQFLENLTLPRQYRVILIPSSTIQLITDAAMAVQALQRLRDHLLPGGLIAASLMTLWQPGEPLYSEWQKSATAEDGSIFQRTARSWYDPETECESTEDLYQHLIENHVVREELHHRAPATRSYTQQQARQLFANAGFQSILCYREFTFEPAQSKDTLFTIVAR